VLADPQVVIRQARARQRRRRRRTAAVMAAVMLTGAGTWLATAQPGGAKPADARPTRPAPSADAAAEAGRPPYYVIADRGRPVAEVRSSKAGKILHSVPLPAGIDPKMSQIAAAGSGRTFALALVFVSKTRFYLKTRFYVLHVAAGGRSARLALLPVPPLPAGEYAAAIAVSPNGRKLAVAVQRDHGQRGAVEVAALATGAVRTWTTSRTGWPTQLSWADHGRELGFFWQDNRPAATSAAGLWVLDTTAAGSSLMSARRILPALAGGDDVQSALLNPDGTTVVAAVTHDGTRHVSRGTVVGGIVELSARTGHPLRTLLTEHAAYSADPGDPGWFITTCEVPAIDATGSHLLVSCDRFGRLDRARFTALPGSAPQTAVAAAW
jgi:dipeptidyl aminopeptidase/acylaminoacyl peptidase